jgi:hypothetical protein
MHANSLGGTGWFNGTPERTIIFSQNASINRGCFRKHEQKFKLDSTFTAAVAQDYYWMPIDDQTPQGVKVLLLGRSGVATMGHYIYKVGETQFWQYWAPLPRKRL